MRSVVRSLACIAWADIAFRVNVLQTQVATVTVSTLHECNRALDLAMRDANRGLTFKSRTLDWKKDFVTCTFADASFATQTGFKSQQGRIHYLCDHATVHEGSATQPRHVLNWSSSTIKRAWRATLQAKTYSLQASPRDVGSPWMAYCDFVLSSQLMRHSWYSDCRSLTEHLSARVPRPVTDDRRLGIELAWPRQSVWTSEDVPAHEACAPYGDTVMDSYPPPIGRYFTKSMKQNLQIRPWMRIPPQCER